VSILIKDVLLGDQVTSIYIEENRIVEIGKKTEADVVIDGRGKAAVPGLVNAHTHAAMTLFRSYADDLRLQEWLETRIWPLEAKLTGDDVYWGTKLACVEMIRSGTTCFNDMYFHTVRVAEAVREMGIRAVIAEGLIDRGDPATGEKQLRLARDAIRKIESLRCNRIVPALGPHAIYSLSKETFQAVEDLADAKGYIVHTHLAETQAEVDDCVTVYGMRPAKYLESLGVLSRKFVAAHGCWLEPEEIEALAKDGAKVVHCPVSNMKMGISRAMPYARLKDAGVLVALGTDGASSNNNLDMFESMKFAALLEKFATGDPTVAPARDVFEMATLGGAQALGIDTGLLEVNRLADVVLIDLKRAELTPRFDLRSLLVYAANGSAVDTLICDGEVLMRGRKIKGEAEILQRAAEVAADVTARGAA